MKVIIAGEQVDARAGKVQGLENLRKDCVRKTKQKPASERKCINLEIGPTDSKIMLVPGCRPYLWIGDKVCYACVPNRNIKKLRDFCNEILKRRSK